MTTTNGRTYKVPVRSEVSENNKTLFDKLQKRLGFVPNFYAFISKSETALADYLAFQNRESTLTKSEREVVKLVVSQVNKCHYCQSAYTALSELNGFTEEQTIEFRKASASWDDKLDALVKFASAVAHNRGNVSDNVKEKFFAAGYTEANLVDAVIVIGDTTISNYINNLIDFEIDFPLADAIE